MTPKEMYRLHKYNAKRRDIPFLFMFEEWLKIWTDSGHLHKRGPRRGQYVMARFGDKGPYSVGNVQIIMATQNNSVKGKGKGIPKPKSEEHRRNISKALKGLPKSPQHCRKLSEAMKGNKNTRGHKLTEDHKKKIGVSVKGKLKGIPKSIEHRAALSRARKGKPWTTAQRAAHERYFVRLKA